MQPPNSLATFPETIVEHAARFLLHDTPVSLVVGQTTSVNLRVQNLGASTWQQRGRAAVHVGYRWFDHTGQPMLDEDRRTALPREVMPNDQVVLGAILVAPHQPGIYHLVWGLIAQGKWFEASLKVPVTVTATPCEVTGWRVESPLNPAEVVHAIDGDMFTAWDSGMPQAPQQWFRLNLGMPRMVDGVQFLSPGRGFPNGYVLHASSEGKAWNALARVTAGNTHDIVAIFAPQKIQYLQIDLLAPAQTHWLISDVLIHAASAWTASASHNVAAASLAIDNRDDTQWTSVVPQAPAMWFQIDLGRVELVSGITLDSPVEHLPVSFRVVTWNARVRRWQIVYEKSPNDTPVAVSFPATATQFINIQLLTAAAQPWSIRHVIVEREMETWFGPSQMR